VIPPPPQRFALRWNSVRTRLILWNVGVLALLLIGFGLLIQYAVRTTLMNSVDHDLSVRADHEAPRRPPPPGGGPPPPRFHPPAPRDPAPEENPPNESAASRTRQDLRPHVLDRNGHGWPPFGEDNPWDPDAYNQALQGQALFSMVDFEGEPLRVYSRPIFGEDGIIGVYQVPYPLQEIDQALSGVHRALLTLIPVVLLLAGLGGAFLANRALSPVRRLSQAAGRIGAQDLSERLPTAGEDEFAELSSTFNGMLERLEVAFSRMEALVAQKQQMIEQQRRFTADASHELRTPLTVIKANTSLNLSGSPSSEEYRQSMEDIDRAAGTMTRLVLDLLLLARADEERLGLNRIAIPLPELLQGVAEGVRRPGGAPIIVQTAEALEVHGNPDELARVFSNLLENASRHTPASGQILVTAYPEAGHSVIKVADTGSGIAPEHLPHLCERFYRADAARTRADGGTGLGLAICRSIVEAHGGTLSIQSELGKGATVTVTL